MDDVPLVHHTLVAAVVLCALPLLKNAWLWQIDCVLLNSLWKLTQISNHFSEDSTTN